MMNFGRLIPVILSAPLCVAGCSQQEQSSGTDVAPALKTLVVAEPESDGIRSFSARIEATRRAEVSFRVPGKIVELPVVEGETVKKDQIVAKLDQTEYQLVVDDRQAELFRAQRDFERARELVKKEVLPQKELDRREANMKRARAALNRATQDLNYTVLGAPFDGQISKRLVQNFEEIQAKQAIVELRDIEALEVKFNVPEQIMLRVTERADQEGERPDIFVAFEDAPGKRFDLTFREIATTADPATRTFEATYTMNTPKDLTVLPGMTANVTADLRKYIGSEQITYVPVEAVVSSNELQPRVWVVDVASMTVRPKPVSVGALRGNSIAVTEGLKPKDRIVIEGVPFLVEGMKVRLKAEDKQAAERVDHLQLRRAAEASHSNETRQN